MSSGAERIERSQSLPGGLATKCLRRKPVQAGFTLLEVLIALAILTVSLLILVSAQSSAAKMSAQADRILVGSMLARARLAEQVLTLEKDGFSEQEELDDEGDFEESFPGAYPEFRWHLRIRKVEVEDISRVLDTAQSAGADTSGGEDGGDGNNLNNSMMDGVMQQVSQTLAERVREVTVRVEWPEGDGVDDVTLTDYVTRK